jgi:hypothetical protein
MDETKKVDVKHEGDVFEFDPIKHRYKLNGVDLTGTTTVLRVIDKPALIQWAANMACTAMETAMAFAQVNNYDLDKIKSEFPLWLADAKSAHRKKKEDAGAKGTDIHAVVEGLIKESMKTSGYIDYKGEESQVLHFVNWALENKVKFLASEERIYSKEWWVGGTCDFLCEIDGNLWLGDIKTSSGIYPEHFFQTAAYQKMYEEMGLHLNFAGNVILLLRKDGTFEEKRSVSNVDNLKAFEAALTLYRVIEKINKTVI